MILGRIGGWYGRVHPKADSPRPHLPIASGASTPKALELWCPVAYPRHLVIGHVTPALVLAAVGAVLGRGVMKLRNDT